MKIHDLIFGTAYYPEYMPYERMEQDMQMMKDAGMNTIRIGESTWSTWEPQDGTFDFSLLTRTIETAQKYNLSVIVGTPTYAVPTWLVRKHPDILTETHDGPCRYGHRQNMDITNPNYLFHAERIIRKMMEQVKDYPNVIGFQLDNETKSYDTCSTYAQKRFIAYLQKKFHSIEEMNEEYGLSYWSNRINAWEDFPDIRGTINGSLGAEYERYQRYLVTEFLAWQSNIVKEYTHENQFITHNFDYDWRDYSYGMQPEVDQFEAVKSLSLPGFDLYHPSQSHLTGAEITFGGSIGRAVAKQVGQPNYLILETQAQGNTNWLPYPNQLRLQGYFHLANGADSVMYWHWHSIHNAKESYWKGVLSHDLQENATYQEAKKMGHEFEVIGDDLLHLTKNNQVAIMLDTQSMSGMKWFPISDNLKYNDIARWFADALHEMNVEYDVVSSGDDHLSNYKVLIVPALYCASTKLKNRLIKYTKNGGHLVASFKSFFADENLKISCEQQPSGMTECFGMTYDQFTNPVDVCMKFETNVVHAHEWMELLRPTTADAWRYYNSIPYQGYASVTHNEFGKGTATYVGCYFKKNELQKLLKKILKIADIKMSKKRFPIVVRRGINQFGDDMTFAFNFSNERISTIYEGEKGRMILKNDELVEEDIDKGDKLVLEPWNLVIVIGDVEL